MNEAILEVNLPQHHLDIDIRSLEWVFPYAMVADDEGHIQWISDALKDKVPEGGERRIFELLEPDPRFNKQSEHWMLRTVDGVVPLEGRCVEIGDGTIAVLAFPEPERISAGPESEGTLESLIDAMSEGMIILDRSGIIKKANQAAEAILGVSKMQIEGKRYPEVPWRFLSPDGTPMNPDELPGFRSLREGISVRGVEMIVVQPEGELRRITGAAAPVAPRGGEIEGAVVTLVDVTVSRNIEQVLARNEATMRAILEHAPFGVLLIDHEFRVITMANRYAADLIGLALSEIEGRVCHAFICPSEKGHCPVADLEQSVDNSERVLITANGRHVPVLKTVVPVELDEQLFLLDCFIDITDRKMLETQLGQAQKLESVGRLAAGIAHEINTPAQYVGDNAQFLKEAFAEITKVLERFGELEKVAQEHCDLAEAVLAVKTAVVDADLEFLLDEIPHSIDQTIEGIAHVSNIVRAMKEFAHPGVEQKVYTDINAALKTTMTVSRSEWKYAAEIELDLDVQMPQVPCYPGEINQVFLNLIVNAAHAVSDAQAAVGGTLGKIILRTRKVGDGAEIRIEDNGTGIPQAIRDKIMDPFFTTKEVGRGTGQGLAIARSCVVDKHGGTLTFETEEGKGTTFIILLPLK